MSISKLFNISSRSLAVYQRALSVSSHNVANANNPNFTRQRVDFGTERDDIRVDGAWGSGIKIDAVLRVRDKLTDIQIRNYNQKFADADKRSNILSQVEGVISEPSPLGLSNLLTQFFNSWDELASSPTSIPLRTNVVQSAEKLASKFQNVYEDISQIQNDLRNEMREKVNTINNYLKEVEVLNKQIFESKVGGHVSNELLDRRDFVVDELSKLANINVNQTEDGSLNISIGGIFAVDKFHSIELEMVEVNGKLAVAAKGGGSVLSLNGGELHATIDFYSNILPGYQQQLDDIAKVLFDKVNSIHSQGYSTTNPPLTGINFFESYAGGKLVINGQILNNPNLIAVSSDGTAGNGDIALQLGNLRNAKVLNDKSLAENYSIFVSGIGNSKLINMQTADSNKMVIEQLELQRASYSGVSIDEEMTNVLRFQRSFDASAKLIRIADEMLQTLLSMV